MTKKTYKIIKSKKDISYFLNRRNLKICTKKAKKPTKTTA